MNKKTLLDLHSQSLLLFRAISVFFGLVLAFWYSKLMGPEIRSFLSFVLISNAFIAYLLLSGISFRLRASSGYQQAKELVGSYLLLCAFAALLTVLIEQLLVSIFSLATNAEIPANATIMIATYSFLVALNIVALELLSCLDSLKSLLFIELVVVSVQLGLFGILIWVEEFSLFVTVLLTYSLSYSLCIFATIVLLVSQGFFSRASLATLSTFFGSETFYWQIRFTFLNLVQRFDKVLIPFFYPSPLLAQVTTYASILGTFRFIPESETRLLANQNLHTGLGRFKLLFSRTKLVLIFTVAAITSFVLISIALGPSWLLPARLALIVAIYEIVVWQYQRVIVSTDKSSLRLSHRALLGFGLIYLVSVPILMSTFDFGLVLFMMTFVLAILYIRNRFSRLFIRK